MTQPPKQPLPKQPLLKPPSPLPIRPLPLPPAGFDPSTAQPTLVLRYGLPAPRPGDGPAAAAFRRAFLAPPAGRPLLFVEAVPPGAAPGPVTVRTHGLVPAGRSVNWSGGSLAAEGARSLVGVMARWRVPAVSGAAGRPARASAWIGFDGQGFYRNASLPQIGTLQAWDGAGAHYEAWVQWWARGEEHAPQTLGLDVAPGDEVSAMLTLLDPATVRFNLKNETTGTMLQAFDVAAPGGRHVSGATAEWILERPSPLGSDGWHPYPLADYATCPFTACLAQTRGPGEAAPSEHDLARASLIRMIAIEADPARIRTISYPARVAGDPRALGLTYGSPF
ncbi:G1 family glutamic endopeptidase [Methylobacterium sp. SyP6R]|uniref:G1 family glutamic endopeptidase n=1 Tax=Methylobacterium sp. SyP6R TaxID=2718876 RepID=UPI001F02B647|nr:G1 family glutamic endopeptidase [Methylobacterium sp. SyP6R]MCF4128279.1 G1 family endopeptidase [Methylobacterium sp. SyP6R]